MSRLSNRGAPTPEKREKDSVILTYVATPPSTRVVTGLWPVQRGIAPPPLPRVASGFSRPQSLTNDFSSRVILWIADDDDATSTAFDFGALWDAVNGIVSPLGVEVGTDFANDRARVGFWKDNDGVHIRQGRKNFSAFFSRHHGTPFAFQCPHRCVCIYRHNQLAA
jgi:hypothetical protein